VSKKRGGGEVERWWGCLWTCVLGICDVLRSYVHGFETWCF